MKKYIFILFFTFSFSSHSNSNLQPYFSPGVQIGIITSKPNKLFFSGQVTIGTLFNNIFVSSGGLTVGFRLSENKSFSYADIQLGILGGAIGGGIGKAKGKIFGNKSKFWIGRGKEGSRDVTLLTLDKISWEDNNKDKSLGIFFVKPSIDIRIGVIGMSAGY